MENENKNIDAILLIYDWTKVNGIQCTNPSDTGMSISIPVQWYTELVPNPLYTSAQVLSEFILHELCHYFFGLQNILPDITHNYDPAFGQLPRDTWYLHLLKQFIPTTPVNTPPTMPQNAQPDVILTRTSDDGKETLGQLLTADKQFGCFTLERPWLNNQLNISCVPKGSYNCIWAYQGDLKEYHYELQNTAPRSGIFIHEGTFNSDTEGCILLGGLLVDYNNDGEKDLGNSRIILTAFEKKMGQKPFTLQII